MTTSSKQYHIAAQNDIVYIIYGEPPARGNDFPVHEADRVAVARVIDEALASSLVNKLEAAEDALRSIASYVSAGGYNSPTVDARVFEEKIRWGIDQLARGTHEETSDDN